LSLPDIELNQPGFRLEDFNISVSFTHKIENMVDVNQILYNKFFIGTIFDFYYNSLILCFCIFYYNRYNNTRI
jgi:hypothetical protein